jgi:hypothetical protein
MEPRVYEVLVRMAELTGNSRGAFVAELLDEMYPSLCRTVALLDAARGAPEQVKKGFAGVVDALERDIRKGADEFSDCSFSALEDALKGAAGGDSTPVSVTRGSGTKDQGVTDGKEGES